MSFTDLPNIDEIIDINSICPVCTGKKCKCRMAISVKERARQVEHMLDNRLKNWNVWLERRKKIHEKLCKNLNRQPGDLLMNSFEELRQTNEIRLREYYEKRYTEPDPQRGCPGFWKMPHYLKPLPGQRGPTHFAVMTPLEKCELPSVDYVRIPTEVQKKKDVLPRSRFTIARDLLDRQRPELDNLIVSSVPIWHDIFKQETVKEVTVTETITESVQSPVQPESPEVEPQPTRERFHIKINGLDISPSSNVMGTRKVYLLFDYDLSKKEMMTQYLHMENLGCVVVRYYWIPNPKYEMFADIVPDKPVKSLFFFNKNEQILMPEATYDFPVSFKTHDEGIYLEQWQLRFKPATVSDSLKLVIVMHASAFRGDEKDKKEKIEKHIANNVRSRLIEECLEYVFPKRRRKTSRAQVYTYNKKEIFEAINTEFSPCDKRVRYLYNKEVVEQLEDLYYILRRSSDPLYWNLSLTKLMKLAKYHDIKCEALERKKIFTAYDEYVEMGMKVEEEKAGKFQDQLEANRKKILQKYTTSEELEMLFPPQSEEQIKIAEEHPHVVLIGTEPENDEEETAKDIPSLIKILEQSTEMNKYTKYFNWLVEKLERQVTITNEDLVTFRRVYAILCTYFDIIEQKVEQLKSIVHVDPKRHFVTHSSREENNLQRAAGLSLVQSFFKMPEWHVENTIHVPREPPPPSYKTDKPPPENLKDIPLEECKKRYKTYYNLPMTPPPGGKGKGGKGDKKKGKDKSDKGSAKTDKGSKKGGAAKEPKEVDDGYKVNENFDPFAEELPTEIPLEKNVQSTESTDNSSTGKALSSRSSILRKNIITAYDHNVYVIFYVYICRAIDEIVDVLSIFERNVFPLPTVNEIYQSRHFVHKKLINVKRLVTGSKPLKVKVQVPQKKHWFTKEMEESIARVQSKSSLWSLLYPQEQLQQREPREAKKPISYPETIKAVGQWQTPVEAKSTSTVEGGVLDVNFEYFKDKSVQKFYRRADEKDDLEEYIEKVQYVSSAQNLHYECVTEESDTIGTATETFLTSTTSTTEKTGTADTKDKKSSGTGSLKPDLCGEDGNECTNPDCKCKL
ncbi:uncharacterized protein LOC112904048 [Agrilus planipennis]|uniref:Uncharacterized protein LOC108739105 n=1 Tax=Agrilus planipennis TaxID=224129 RepID=A0A1W4WWV2_AGRPL|nr:uncharacterized protein LOC108739105 [Agrilus planipennis]XP_025828993.1 uncharacterized protein LOC112904048 [Agrilus planipennis]